MDLLAFFAAAAATATRMVWAVTVDVGVGADLGGRVVGIVEGDFLVVGGRAVEVVEVTGGARRCVVGVYVDGSGRYVMFANEQDPTREIEVEIPC